jgi:hypothetical protein
VAYIEFTQRLIDRFDQGDPKLHFRELTQLRQTGSPEVYIEEFQRIAVMVQDVSMETRDALHRSVDGTLKGLGKGFQAYQLTGCYMEDKRSGLSGQIFIYP